ncbi:MAG: DUF4911 domain-containing protein [Candidatus Cloacimonetes bacterium]|nr:DUF4911 domain-containing protein [Candidatus Cloacimonadota bacterium]
MKIKQLEETVLADGTIRKILEIAPADFVLFGFLLEGFEGFCNYTTIVKDNRKVMQLDISPDYRKQVMEIITHIGETVSSHPGNKRNLPVLPGSGENPYHMPDH